MVPNSDFETAGTGGADVFANWTASVTGTSAVTAVAGESGGTAARLTADASNSAVQILSTFVPTIGKKYRVTARVRGSANGTFFIPVMGGNQPVIPITTAWATYTVDMFCTTDGALLIKRAAPSYWFEIDNVTVEEYSAAILISPLTNNGGFETAGAGGVDAFGSWFENTSGGTQQWFRDTTTFDSGSASARLDTDGTSVGIYQYVAAAGKTVRYSLRGKNSGSGGIRASNGPYQSNHTFTSSWATYSGELYCQDALVLFQRAASTEAGASLWIDNVIVEQPLMIISGATLNGNFSTLSASVNDVAATVAETVAGTSVIRIDPNVKDSGSYSLALDIDSAGSVAQAAWANQCIVGNWYRATARVRQTTAGQMLCIGRNDGTSQAAITTGWTTVTVDFFADSTSFIIKSIGAAGSTYNIDGVTLQALKINATNGIAAGAATVGDAVNLISSAVGTNTLNQAVFSKRPRLDANGITFDALDDLMDMQSSVNAAEVWTVQRSTPTGPASVVRTTTPFTVSALAIAGKTIADYFIFTAGLTPLQAAGFMQVLKRFRGAA